MVACPKHLKKNKTWGFLNSFPLGLPGISGIKYSELDTQVQQEETSALKKNQPPTVTAVCPVLWKIQVGSEAGST